MTSRTNNFPAWIVCTLTLIALPALAAVRLPSVFGDHMVLQRDREVPVWGWANAGEEVTVRFADQEVTAAAAEDGRWQVRLAAMPADSKAQELVVAGENQITLKNVLVGDVWVCSGQSNMEWTVRSSLNAKEEIAAAKYPLIRHLKIPHNNQPAPVDDVKATWAVCNPQNVAHFTAVGYYFGRKLHTETGIPIGLIGSNWGGTRVEPWTPPVGFKAVPQLAGIAKRVAGWNPATAEGRKMNQAFIAKVEKWVVKAEAAVDKGGAPPALPASPVPGSHQEPTKLYNGMIHPLLPYAICGAIWYQGESNGGEGESYFHKMQALIQGWRTVWQQDDFPFYLVQLANFQKSDPNNSAGGDGWAKLREAQRKTLTIPKTGMAVIIDIGQANDIHPRNKQDVGARLARWALRDVHGQEVVVSGPLYKSHKLEGSKIRISFDHTGSGLIIGKKQGLAPTEEVTDGELKWFAIAGADKQWHWAQAVIEGDTVVVSAEQVAAPVAVRYAFTMNPDGANLYNKEGIPASPFRTDNW